MPGVIEGTKCRVGVYPRPKVVADWALRADIKSAPTLVLLVRRRIHDLAHEQQSLRVSIVDNEVGEDSSRISLRMDIDQGQPAEGLDVLYHRLEETTLIRREHAVVRQGPGSVGQLFREFLPQTRQERRTQPD